MASIVSATSCGHSATTVPAIGVPLSLAYAAAPPPTVHVIPFYDYGKLGYDLPGGGAHGGLIGSPASLYGATAFGGDTKCSTRFDSGSITGCGIVYRLAPVKGKRTYKIDVLYAFKGEPADGAASYSTLLADKSGNLYGTTFYGGKYDGGTLFELHPTSSGYTESVVYNFGNGQDAAFPISGVIEVNGILYGTTLGGGTHTNEYVCHTKGGSPNGTCGTVYSVNPASGTEQVLHSFGGGTDGASPFAAPLDVGGTLYGTTDLGGAFSLCGTVYSIGTDGSNEKVVHSFRNAPVDGCDPFANLIDVKGTLYGTTASGGGNYCGHCEGTLFSIDLSSGKEQVLHKFGNDTDGSEPVAAVADVHGVLYGTTTTGGGTSCTSGDGCGTVFSYSLSASPAYATLYDFSGGNDGAAPFDALLYSHGAFYATTTSGGKKSRGTGDKLRL